MGKREHKSRRRAAVGEAAADEQEDVGIVLWVGLVEWKEPQFWALLSCCLVAAASAAGAFESAAATAAAAVAQAQY